MLVVKVINLNEPGRALLNTRHTLMKSVCKLYRITLLKEYFVYFIAVILQKNSFPKKKKSFFFASNCDINISLYLHQKQLFKSPKNCKMSRGFDATRW